MLNDVRNDVTWHISNYRLFALFANGSFWGGRKLPATDVEYTARAFGVLSNGGTHRIIRRRASSRKKHGLQEFILVAVHLEAARA